MKDSFFKINDAQYSRLIRLLLSIFFIIGILSIFYRSPMSWLDEQIHYARVIQLSNGDVFKSIDNDNSKWGGDISRNHQEFIDRAMSKIVASLSSGENSIISDDWSNYYNDLDYTEDKHFHIATGAVPYVPAVYGIYVLAADINKLLHLNVVNEYKLMKLLNFIFCYLLLLVTVRVAPYHKLAFCAIFLLPTTVLTLSSITADAVSFSISFLFLAYTLNLFNRIDKGFSIDKSSITFYLVISLGVVISKMPAFMLIALYIPLIVKDYIAHKKITKFNLTLFFSAILFALFTLYWLYIIQDINTGAYHGKNDVNTHQQITYITHNFLDFLTTLLKSILGYNFLNMQLGYADRSYYMYIPNIFSYLFLIGFVLSFFIQDHQEEHKKNLLLSIFSLSSFIVITVLVFTLLYLQFTQVGEKDIVGVQARYFIPYFPLLIIAFPFLRFKQENFNLKRFAAFLILLPLLYYSLLFINQLFIKKSDRLHYEQINSIPSNLGYNGFIDEFKITDRTIFIRGWGMLSNNKENNPNLLIYTNSRYKVEYIDRNIRSDVSNALNNRLLDNSGFTLRLTLDNRIQENLRICIISQDKKFGEYKIKMENLNNIYSCE